MAHKTDEELQAYIDNLRLHGVRSKAARAAGMSLRTVMQYVDADEAFAEEERLAQIEAADHLEEEARRRAVDGVTRMKVLGSGKNASFIEEQHYSDGLLTLLLKGAMPEKYAERSKQELSGPGGAAIEFDQTASAARIASILAEAKARREADTDPLLE